MYTLYYQCLACYTSFYIYMYNFTKCLHHLLRSNFRELCTVNPDIRTN